MQRAALPLAALLAACSTADPLTPSPFRGGTSDGGGEVLDAGFRPDATPQRGTGLPPDAAASDANPADTSALDSSAEDSATLDTGTVDAGTLDAGAHPDAAAPADAGQCGLGEPGPADKPRVLLVGHPFGAMAGQRGTDVQGFSISAQGMPVAGGARVSVGFPPERIAFTANGAFALVLGERGDVVTLAVGGASALMVADRTRLPGAGYSDLIAAPDPGLFFATSSDVGATSGVVSLRVDCLGRVTVDSGAFFNIRLADSIAVLAGGPRALLLGGQAVFAPVDANDIRLLERTATGWRELNAFDIFHDAIDSGHIAASPDGRTVVVPNGSPFSTEGATVSVLEIAGDVVRERVRLTSLPDAREALFSPDGTTALVARGQPGRVTVIADRGSGWAVADELRGVGLADQMALIARGPHAGHVYVSSTDPTSGPNIAVLEIRGPAMVADLGQLALGMGNTSIPGPVAVTP